MPNFRVLLAACAAVLVAAVIAAPAGASYGELPGRFGEQGTGSEQFSENPETAAFGVDPTNNNVYVGDEPEAHVFRIQRLTSAGKLVAEFRFRLKGTEERPSGIEGIAVDPTTAENSEGRIYVLALMTRKETAVVDANEVAAGALYAFNITGEKLEPAAGTKETEGKKQGLLTSLHGESEELGKTLLEPSGIAVDSKTHEVIAMGKEDRGETAEEPTLRVALERVKSTGAIGPRWVDKAKPAFFESSEEATSPAVSKSGKVYVVGGELGANAGEPSEQIDEIPSNFESSEPPKATVKFNAGPSLAQIVRFPGEPPTLEGGGLSLAPDGTFYAYATINYEEGVETFNHARGALTFSEAGAELGWTGGRAWSKSGSAPPCSISFEAPPMVAAGGEGRVFIFDRNPAAPTVVEFGPGGSGCPTARASALSAKVKGKPVTTVEPGTEVQFASNVMQANALSVEWNFGDGTTAKTEKDQYQTTEIAHTFTKEGPVTVTEKIHTDDLATPEVTTSVKLHVEVPHPRAEFSESAGSVNVGVPVTFDATSSSDPYVPPHITKYTWEFGDGTPSETRTEEPTTVHAYSAAGTYTVTLRVTDAHGLTSAPHEETVTVTTPSTGGGGGGGGGGETNTTTTPTTTTPTTTTPTTSVLSYNANLAGTSLAVSPTGALVLKVACLGQSSCKGTVTLRTLNAVSAGARKAVLTLATGSFTAAGGHVVAVTLHLSAKARKLLAKLHVLRARAMIVARDSEGKVHPMRATVTLRLKAKHH
jgi:PKD repeat protein